MRKGMLMTKFIALWEEDCEGIFDTRGDAEEYILSVAEESAYEDFLCYDNIKDWLYTWRLENLEDVWKRFSNGGYKKVPRQTSKSAILSYFSEGWHIQECNYFPE